MYEEIGFENCDEEWYIIPCSYFLFSPIHYREKSDEKKDDRTVRDIECVVSLLLCAGH
jgi:hypothetical protein